MEQGERKEEEEQEKEDKDEEIEEKKKSLVLYGCIEQISLHTYSK